MSDTLYLSDGDKWLAVKNCDPRFDGKFFYGVRTTGIFCRPSCRSKTPAKENTVFFSDVFAAREAGFRPCKKCRPDKAKFEPGLEVVEKAIALIDENCSGDIDLRQVSKRLGLSLNHLTRLFRIHRGKTPAKYLAALRVERACGLLGEGGLSVLETAYAAGFKSLSSFYKCFKAHTGYSPGEYKNRR